MTGTIPPHSDIRVENGAADAALSAFNDVKHMAKLGWHVLTQPWSNVDGREGRYLAINVDQNLATSLQRFGKKLGVDIGAEMNGPNTALLTIRGKDNIQKFHDVRMDAQARLSKLVVKAPWDDVLPLDNKSSDIAFAQSNGVETGFVTDGMSVDDKNRLLRGLGMLDISYALDTSGGKEAVFLTNPDDVGRLDSMRQSQIDNKISAPVMKQDRPI